jgi:Ferredoxin
MNKFHISGNTSCKSLWGWTESDKECRNMKAFVDQDTCIACGMCVSSCNDVFEFNDDGKAEAIVDLVPPELEEDARQAANNCPVNAIGITE